MYENDLFLQFLFILKYMLLKIIKDWFCLIQCVFKTLMKKSHYISYILAAIFYICFTVGDTPIYNKKGVQT